MERPDPKNLRSILIILLVAAVIGVFSVLFSISRYGPGLSEDSAYYISAARNLGKGEGLTTYEGKPFVRWPPLFPLIIATLSAMNMEAATAAGIANSIAFGAAVFLGGLIVYLLTKSMFWTVAAALHLLLSPFLLGVAVMALSEMIFITLSLAVILCAHRLELEKLDVRLIVLALVSGLVCLQRFIGVSIVAACLITMCIGILRQRKYRKLYLPALYGVISLSPLLAWIIRNLLVTGTCAAIRIPTDRTLIFNLKCTAVVISRWLIPLPAPDMTKVAIAFVFVIIIGILLFHNRRIFIDNNMALLALVYTIVYVVFLNYIATVYKIDDIRSRLLSAIYVPLTALAVLSLNRLEGLLNAKKGLIRNAKHVLKILLVAWIVIIPSVGSYHRVGKWRSSGAGGYNSKNWRESATVGWVRDNGGKYRIFSNIPEGIYLLTPVIPELAEEEEDVYNFTASDRSALVWFTCWGRPLAENLLRELLEKGELKLTVFSDSEIYYKTGEP